MNKIRKKKIGSLQRKILLLCLGGLALSASRSFSDSIEILKEMEEEWEDINKQTLRRSLEALYEAKLLEERTDKNGVAKLFPSKEGEKLAEIFSIDELGIPKPAKWDGNWRVITFDIPEPKKKIREALRHHLKSLEFYEFQKSVFIHPFPCVKEVSYIIEFYDIKRYVRTMIAHSVDNEIELRKKFGL